jgi:hypothetical protein
MLPFAVQCKVHVANIAELLLSLRVPRDLGLLSIDVDGMDWWLWKIIGAWWEPAIVVIEYNASVDPLRCVTVPYADDFAWDGSDYFGASAGAMVSLAHNLGYALVTDVCHANLFFVRAALLPPDHKEPDLATLGGPQLGRRLHHDPRPWAEV